MRTARFLHLGICFLALISGRPSTVLAQETLPAYLQDRGPGIPSSMFGTYIKKGQLLVYPFYETYYDRNAEYEPNDFGYGLTQEFRGQTQASEALIFIGYGLSDRLAIEVEAAVITAEIEKAVNDPSAMPAELKESGLGDVESQLRWRWFEEKEGRPELFSYFETVFPLQKTRKLIGTRDWEFKLGTGIVKGFTWGTITIRTAVDYSREDRKFSAGEYAVEYLKRVSKSFRLYLGVEGTQDEAAVIPEIQWQFNSHAFLKINNGFGLTSKATDFSPEIGVMLSF